MIYRDQSRVFNPGMGEGGIRGNGHNETLGAMGMPRMSNASYVTHPGDMGVHV